MGDTDTELRSKNYNIKFAKYQQNLNRILKEFGFYVEAKKIALTIGLENDDNNGDDWLHNAELQCSLLAEPEH